MPQKRDRLQFPDYFERPTKILTLVRSMSNDPTVTPAFVTAKASYVGSGTSPTP